jgi:hypothetical protein
VPVFGPILTAGRLPTFVVEPTILLVAAKKPTWLADMTGAVADEKGGITSQLQGKRS